MTITAADFWVVHTVGPWDGSDTEFGESLDTERLTSLIAGPDTEHSDLDVSLALMDLSPR